MRTRNDIENTRFTRLTALSCETVMSGKKRKKKRRYWTCECVCGKIVKVLQDHLTRGLIRSCGCYALERRTVHGFYKSRSYKVWGGMVGRCEDTHHKAYRNYGGRGVIVEEPWRSNPETFCIWYEANWREGFQVDREDNNGNYSENNCRMVTKSANNQNTRRNRHITINGERLCVAEAVRRYGGEKVTPKIAYWRLDHGWSEEESIKSPSRKGHGKANRGMFVSQERI